MRDAAGEPADRVQLLGLQKLLLQLTAIGDVEAGAEDFFGSAGIIPDQTVSR